MQVIPTFPDDANYVIRTTLDGTAYQLTFRYSARSSCYFIDLALDDGTLLVGGRKLVCLLSIWRIFRYDTRVPQGSLVAFPTAGASDAPADIGELGTGRRVELRYFAPGELAAAAAGS